MKKLLSLPVVVAIIMLAACSSPQPRTIEKPAIAATNNAYLDIAKVELTDSATSISFHISFVPGWWIQLAEESKIVADGKEYALTGADGIVPGEHFTMPASGEAEFTLTFAPVPLETETIDFTEGTADGWVLSGIDVSGKPSQAAKYPAGMPKELREPDMSAVCTEPVLETAPTELRFHVPGFRPEYGNKLTLYIYNIADSEETTVELDENGEGTLSPTLYGTSSVDLIFSGVRTPRASFTVAPGETTDIYVSPVLFSDFVDMVLRKGEGAKSPYIYTNSRYASLDRAMNTIQAGKTAEADYDWHMNGDEFIAATLAGRDKALAAIATADAPEGAKKYASEKVDIATLESVLSAQHELANVYRQETGRNDWQDSVRIEITPGQFASVYEAVIADGDNTSYLAHPEIQYLAYRLNDFRNRTGYAPEGTVFTELPVYCSAYSKATGATLTDDDTEALRALSQPFYAQAATERHAKAAKALEEARSAIAENPDVPDNELFDAIVAPHKGKVVLVDLWNTWCGPCRNALKTNEPLKTGELADDDIVWIYIADTSSDMGSYSQMIKDIKGEHHIVNDAQIAAIRSRFNVDGIPYYILVDRQGNATGHPDFRDHAVLVEGIKGAL